MMMGVGEIAVPKEFGYVFALCPNVHNKCGFFSLENKGRPVPIVEIPVASLLVYFQ